MTLALSMTLPGLNPQQFPLAEPRMIMGSLLSNQIAVRAQDVEPIHALIEEIDGRFFITDLDSRSGILLNGKKIEVESEIKLGDTIQVGVAILTVVQQESVAVVVNGMNAAIPPVPVPRLSSTQKQEYTSASQASSDDTQVAEVRKEPKEVLFSPRSAKPSGDILEVVAYWDETVLDVDHFHPYIKNFSQVTIGDPTKANFIAAGDEDLTKYVLADVGTSSYKLRLKSGMSARIRHNGKVEKLDSGGSFELSRRDVAHIKFGAVRYFFLYVRPPVLDIPKSGPKDPVLAFLGTLSVIFYLMTVPFIWMQSPKEKEINKDDIWSIVSLPEKEKQIKEEVEKKPEPPKPKQEIAEVKKDPPPPKDPPKPPPKPPEPAQPKETEKPKQVKAVEKPVEKSVDNKAAEKPNPLKAAQQALKDAASKPVEKAPDAPAKAGMPSTGAKNPDFKLAGAKTNAPLGAAGGAKGSGMNQVGGEIKGNQKASVKGVEGVKNDKPSGVNLSKLGIGVGKVLSNTEPGAIYTDLKSSAGGAGGGMGSGSKTTGLGGVGSGKSLGLAGASGAVSNFGSGSGGFGSGLGGTGGLGGSGLGKSFGSGGPGGRGQADVSVPSDPVVGGGGLTPQEIMQVIRANLNQIRHCYEQLLQRSPNAAGSMTVNWIIGADGTVTSAQVAQSAISDSVMKGCVTGRITRWRFPKPRGTDSVTVNYPFVFNPL